MRLQRNIFQMKEQDKTPKQLSDMEMSSYPREFRVIIVKMSQELGKRVDTQSKKLHEVFNKEAENIKNNQS